MQINSVYLYPNKIDVFASPLASLQPERYRKVYNRNLKVYRSVDNRIDLQLRNSDQKSLVINSILVFNLLDTNGTRLVIKKDCELVADDLTKNLKGRAYVVLTKEELLGLEQGFYQYNIVQETRTVIDGTDEYVVTSKTPLYVDSQYGVNATMEVAGDVNGLVEDSLLVDKFTYTNPFVSGDLTAQYYTSSIIDANLNTATPQSQHTFQFYFTNYEGDVVIQGSLDEQGGTPRSTSWVNITTVDPAVDKYKNITGKWNWFRIKHLPTRGATRAVFVIRQTILLAYEIGIDFGGRGYRVGDEIVINGTALGGESPTNDALITVTAIATNGEIIGITWSGLSYNGVKSFVLSGDTLAVGTLDKVLYR